MGRITGFLILVIGFTGWIGFVFASKAGEEPFPPDMKKGETLYQAHCAECHGPDGHGDGPRAALLAPRPGNLVSAATSTKTDQELLAIIERGVPRTAMTGWQTTLSEDDRKNVLAFIRSLVNFQDPPLTPLPH